MKPILALLCLFLAATAGAQTADLFRKSIGGAVETGAPEGADFGLASDYYENLTVVDSLIYLSPGKALLVWTSYRKHNLNTSAKPTRTGHDRDTLRTDPYGRRHALDSIRRQLRHDFPEGTEHTRFSGYDSLRAAAPRPVGYRPATPAASATSGTSSQPVVPATTAMKAAPAHGPLFAGGTALFALALCAAIAGLYRRAGQPG